MPIPRLIHQTFFKKDGLHPAIQANIASLKSRNPGWTYTLYDDQDIEDFIREHYPPEVMRLYKKINPRYGAARADLFRYLVVYKLGGAYLDIKSTATAALDDLVDQQEYILAHWKKRPIGMFDGDEHLYPYGEYQQWHVIGAPEHPYLKAVLDTVFDNIENYSVERFGVGRVPTIRVTGPVPYTRAIHPIRERHSHKLYKRHVWAGLEYTVMPGISHTEELFTKVPHYGRLKEPIVYKELVNG